MSTMEEFVSEVNPKLYRAEQAGNPFRLECEGAADLVVRSTVPFVYERYRLFSRRPRLVGEFALVCFAGVFTDEGETFHPYALLRANDGIYGVGARKQQLCTLVYGLT